MSQGNYTFGRASLNTVLGNVTTNRFLLPLADDIRQLRPPAMSTTNLSTVSILATDLSLHRVGVAAASSAGP